MNDVYKEKSLNEKVKTLNIKLIVLVRPTINEIKNDGFQPTINNPTFGVMKIGSPIKSKAELSTLTKVIIMLSMPTWK